MYAEQNNDNMVDKYFLTSEQGQIYETIIRYIDKVVIEKALQKSNGNQIEASKLLGMNRNTIRSKIKKLDINVERFKL